MNPILIRLIYSVALVVITGFLTYQWATARAEQKQAEAVTQAVTQLQSEIAEQYKQIDEAVTAYNREALENEEREQRDQRQLRRLKVRLLQTNDSLSQQRSINSDLRDALILLNNAASGSLLPDGSYPAGINQAHHSTTDLELISYTRAIIGQYEREGLRSNKLREVIQELPCVN